jgi:excisionase family DNA binding protein
MSEAITETMTMAEAARYLRCSRAHVSNLVAGKVRAVPVLPHVRVGRRLLFLRPSIDGFLREIESRNRKLGLLAGPAGEADDGII